MLYINAFTPSLLPVWPTKASANAYGDVATECLSMPRKPVREGRLSCSFAVMRLFRVCQSEGVGIIGHVARNKER